jgi:hypothetical protein
MSTYSPLHTNTSTNEKKVYGSPINTDDYNYFEITKLDKPLEYCDGKKVGSEDYLFVSTTGSLNSAKLFGQEKNYRYTRNGSDFIVVYWTEVTDGTNNILNVPTNPKPFFDDVGYKSTKFFVERPINDDESNNTCFTRVKKFLTGSGTKRRKKNKRRKSKKQKKTKKRKNIK